MLVEFSDETFLTIYGFLAPLFLPRAFKPEGKAGCWYGLRYKPRRAIRRGRCAMQQPAIETRR
ncbi:hypothetical protein PSAB6_280045 [Paraburkholderia sabiae]|nr:hypothetical protein PSAB6_280045 [Paraburkholderia sabiae]